jgi:hypothetical protein
MKYAANYRKVDNRKTNYAMQIREKLGLDISASDADVVAAVKKLDQDIGIAKARVELAREAAARHAEAKTVTNAGLSYLKSSAAEIEMQRRRYLDQKIGKGIDAAFSKAEAAQVRAKLQKLQSSDVGTATLTPKVSNGNQALYDAGKAAAQLKALAQEQVRANNKLSMSQAFERVYSDGRNRDLIERAIRTRGEIQQIVDQRSPKR